jgi:putative ABC transport system permease protein
MESIFQDLRYAARQLARTPLFSLAAAATLAIGIGATTAIFSTVNATLLRPLPFPHADELMAIRTRYVDGKFTSGLVSPGEITRLNDGKVSIVRAVGVFANPFDATMLRDGAPPVHVVATGVTEGFFDTLGVPIALGRALEHGDHVVAPNAPLRLVLSHRFWTEMMGRDPAVLGTRIRLAENPNIVAIVVGVAAVDVDVPRGGDFWFGAQFRPEDTPHVFEGIMRVRPGVSLDRVRTEMAGVMNSLAHDFPATDSGREYVVQPLVNQIVGDVRSTLLIILGATGLLLLLASVNVTNLLLARGTARTREAAVRAALGASRGRLMRQLLTESMVLATIGAIAGLALAAAGVRLLLVLGASKLPRLDAVPFDMRVLLFAVVVLVISGLAMGLPPAWRLANHDLKAIVNESGRGASGSRGTSRLMGAMIVAEIALAIVLVAGAGWLIQSFARLRQTDSGFVPSGRLVADVRFTRNFTSSADASAWMRTVLDRMRTTPGVSAIGATSSFPLQVDRDSMLFVQFHGERAHPGRMPGGRARLVTAGFFEAMGIRLVAGRIFTDDDREATAPVAIVNRAFARRFLANRDPLQTQFAYGYPTPDPKTERSIVGVVENVRYKSLAEEAEPAFYVPQSQSFAPPRQSVVISTLTADPIAVVPALRSQLKTFDRELAVEYDTAPNIVASTLSRQELGMTLMLIFGATALVLAAVGIYGVIAYAAAQRRGEVATRMALGASSADVFWLMTRQGQRLAVAGAVIGLVGAYLGGRLVAANVYAMRAADPLILSAAAAAVLAIAALGTLIPAARATRVDPAAVLRGD